MNEIYVVLRNIPYEFGVVAGVFPTRDSAISLAQSLDWKNEEIIISKWTSSADQSAYSEEVSWEMVRGRDRTK